MTPWVFGKTSQLWLVVSSFVSEAAGIEQERLHKKVQKLAAWTSFPLTEGEPVQSASLCFQWSNLHMHNTAVYLPAPKNLPEFGPPLAPWLWLRRRRRRWLLTAPAAFLLSKGYPKFLTKSKALAFKLGHVRCKTMLSHWDVMVMNDNVPCHLQQCKCPDQDLWAPLYILTSIRTYSS